MLIYGAVNGTADSGQNFNIVQHSSGSSGFCMSSVNNTFLGSLTVTNDLSATNLTHFINTSIVNQCKNYNSRLKTFINTSIISSQSNLTTITNLSATNASFSISNININMYMCRYYKIS